MKPTRKHLIPAALAVAVLGAGTAFAGSVTVPNAFSAHTKAMATEVNANFDAVKAAVDDNDGRITTNAAAIANNAADITTNANNISTNTAGISANAADIATNAADIATNAAGIAANASGVAANAANIATLQADFTSATTCPAGMVAVGSVCVDKYEASVWDASLTTQYGTTGDDYPCSDNGNDCTEADATAIVAQSIPGVTPSSYITWFQAAEACANAGKRLITNAEWQTAAAGTPDPGVAGSITNSTCNTNTAGPVATGSSEGAPNACISKWGAMDMVGNVGEWTADWLPGATAAGNPLNTPLYGQDRSFRTYP